MRGREVTPIRKRAVKWLAAALLASACSGPPPVVLPSIGAPAQAKLTVIAAGSNGPVSGLRICASALSGTQSCAPTGPDGIATFSLARATYQIRSETPPSQRRVGELVGADLTRGDASVRLEFEQIRRITGTITDPDHKPVPLAPVCANPLSLAAAVCEKSKADGTYAVDVTPGLYKMSFDGGPGLKLLSQWAYGRVGSGEADVIDVRTADAAGIDVILRRGVSLQGTITNTGGQPVKKAQVCTDRFSQSQA